LTKRFVGVFVIFRAPLPVSLSALSDLYRFRQTNQALSPSETPIRQPATVNPSAVVPVGRASVQPLADRNVLVGTPDNDTANGAAGDAAKHPIKVDLGSR
jgi:hypothetical protein